MAEEVSRNALERALADYDEKHEKAVIEAIMRAVADASLISEPPLSVLRTGELTSALLTVLAAAIALSPEAVCSLAAIRKTTVRHAAGPRPNVCPAAVNASEDPDGERIAYCARNSRRLP